MAFVADLIDQSDARDDPVVCAEGGAACRTGRIKRSNPHVFSSLHYIAWNAGWEKALTASLDAAYARRGLRVIQGGLDQ